MLVIVAGASDSIQLFLRCSIRLVLSFFGGFGSEDFGSEDFGYSHSCGSSFFFGDAQHRTRHFGSFILWWPSRFQVRGVKPTALSHVRADFSEVTLRARNIH